MHHFRPKISRLALFICAIAASLCSLQAIEQKTIDRRVTRILDSLRDMQLEEASRIPPQILKRSKGIIILRQYEAGFVFGGKGGFGVALARDADGEWGSPAWLKTGEGSWGIQIGVQKLNVVFLLMNESALNLLQKPKFRIGVDAAATAGPSGRNVEAKIGNIPVLIYSDTEGLYAGATFEAGFLLPDKKLNLATYGDSYSIPEIINNDAGETPEKAQEIAAALLQIEQERNSDLP